MVGKYFGILARNANGVIEFRYTTSTNPHWQVLELNEYSEDEILNLIKESIVPIVKISKKIKTRS